MVKKIFITLLLISFLTFTLALDEPTSVIGEGDAEKLQENIDKYIPLDESGELDLSGYKPIKSQAEKKIDEINEWLEVNATWLKAVFGMVPSITLLFAINVYLILLLLVVLVFNAEGLFGFMDTLTKKIELGFIKTTWANILGLVIFLLLHLTKAIATIAKIITDQIVFLWEKVIPKGVVVMVIAIIIGVVVVILLQIYAPQVIEAIKMKREAAKEAKAKRKESLNREVLDRVTKGVTQAE
jgi:hypothetical protein